MPRGDESGRKGRREGKKESGARLGGAWLGGARSRTECATYIPLLLLMLLPAVALIGRQLREREGELLGRD